MSRFNFQSTEKISTVLKKPVHVITERVKNKASNALAAFHPGTNAIDGYEK